MKEGNRPKYWHIASPFLGHVREMEKSYTPDMGLFEASWKCNGMGLMQKKIFNSYVPAFPTDP